LEEEEFFVGATKLGEQFEEAQSLPDAHRENFCKQSVVNNIG
jgi:hypothetical protein